MKNVFVWLSNNRLWWFSVSTCRRLHLDQFASAGRSTWATPMPKSLAVMMARARPASRRKSFAVGIESHAEVTVTLKGLRRYFHLTVEPLRDPRGKLVGLLCSAIDITSMKETILKLQQSLDEVQVLKGLLPICASCKRIKDEHETWQILEVYIQAHSGANFTHGICPDCMRKFYPEYSLQ